MLAPRDASRKKWHDPLRVFSTENHWLKQTPKQARTGRDWIRTVSTGDRVDLAGPEGSDVFLSLLVNGLNHIPEGAEGHSHVATQAVRQSICFEGREYQPEGKEGPLTALYKPQSFSSPKEIEVMFQELPCH